MIHSALMIKSTCLMVILRKRSSLPRVPRWIKKTWIKCSTWWRTVTIYWEQRNTQKRRRRNQKKM